MYYSSQKLILIYIQPNNGTTALSIASYHGYHQCVDLLLHSKADPDIQENNGATALFVASQNGHNQCVDLLLQSKADPDIQNNTNGTTALSIASERGHHQCVDLLLQSKANPDIQANDGSTALVMASQNGHHQCVDLLLQSKANPDIQTTDGTTALHMAVIKKQSQCVNLLLESKADPNTHAMKQFKHVTPLMSAVFSKHHQNVSMLLEHNANPNLGSPSPLSIACFFGDLSLVSLLLQYDANIETPGVPSPLIYAVVAGYYDIAKSLINAGANVNVEEQYVEKLRGTTPLMIASTRGNLPMVQLLLQFGADVMIQDKNGFTAIDAAKAYRHQKILTLLTIKLFEQAQTYLSRSEESHESEIGTSSQDDDISLQSQSSVSQQHQESNLETIRNHFNSKLSSFQTSHKSFGKKIELMFENEPRFQQPVY